jgi:hypothetical protein
MPAGKRLGQLPLLSKLSCRILLISVALAFLGWFISLSSFDYVFLLSFSLNYVCSRFIYVTSLLFYLGKGTGI